MVPLVMSTFPLNIASETLSICQVYVFLISWELECKWISYVKLPARQEPQHLLGNHLCLNFLAFSKRTDGQHLFVLMS